MSTVRVLTCVLCASLRRLLRCAWNLVSVIILCIGGGCYICGVYASRVCSCGPTTNISTGWTVPCGTTCVVRHLLRTNCVMENAGFIMYHVVTWPGLRLWRWSGGKSEISIFVCLAVGSGCGRFRAARHFRLGSHVTRSHVSHFLRVHMSIFSCSVCCFSVYISVGTYSHCGWGEIHYLLFIIAGTSSSDRCSIGEFNAFETMLAWSVR